MVPPLAQVIPDNSSRHGIPDDIDTPLEGSSAFNKPLPPALGIILLVGFIVGMTIFYMAIPITHKPSKPQRNVTPKSTRQASQPMAVEKTAVYTPKPVPKPKEWRVLKNWQGQGIKKTEMFTVSSQWRIVWDTRAGRYGSGIFAINVYNANGNMSDVAANVIGNSQDMSYQHKAGTYYLYVIAANQSWGINIEVLE